MFDHSLGIRALAANFEISWNQGGSVVPHGRGLSLSAALLQE
jgi:hypothetical protein